MVEAIAALIECAIHPDNPMHDGICSDCDPEFAGTLAFAMAFGGAFQEVMTPGKPLFELDFMECE